MTKKTKKAFTLVELIIVIAIIAILAVSAFLVLTKWIAKSRDTRRINDLATIRDALNIKSADGSTSLSNPENAAVISYNEGDKDIVISNQGEFGANLIKGTDLKGDMKDPSDATYYTYAVDNSKSNYALMAMLEGDSASYVGQSVYAVDYANRKPRIEGSRVGVVLDDTNTPLVGTSKSINLYTTTADNYKIYLDNVSSVVTSGTFVTLRGGADSTLELYGLYPFLSGSRLNDKSSKGNNLTGTYTAVAGKIGSGAVLTPKLTGDTLNIETTKPFTIMFWAQSINGNIIKIASGSNTAFGISGTNNNIIFYASGDTKMDVSKTQGTSSWTHIAMVVNPSEDKIYMYIEGTQVDSYSFSSDISTTGYKLSIGGATGGNIDELRIYQRSLSATEVKSFYDLEK